MGYGAIGTACRGKGVTSSVDHYLNCNASGGASAPDTAALSITGDIRLRVDVAMTDWTPAAAQTFIAKTNVTGNQLGYRFIVNTAGTLGLALSLAGTAYATSANSSAATSFVDGTRHWVGVDWRASDGRVQFFTSADNITWTQLGTDKTISIASIFDNTAPLWIAASDSGASLKAVGKFYRALVYNAIDGTGLQFDGNFTPQAAGTSSFTESSSNAATVTVQATASIV